MTPPLSAPTPSLAPLLVVRDAARAVALYVDALGAREVGRHVHGARGTISHADLVLGDAALSVTEEARAWNSDAPPSLGGSPVVLQLRLAQLDATFERMRAAGAEVVFPLQEFRGVRMGRLRDPFGHLWLLSDGRGSPERPSRTEPTIASPVGGEQERPKGSPQLGRLVARA